MSTKVLAMNAHSSFVHNRPKFTITQMPITGEWINKLYRNHTVEYYSAIKRKKVITDISNNQGNYAKTKKPNQKKYILYNCIYIKY